MATNPSKSVRERKRPRETDQRVVAAVEQLALMGWRAAEINQVLRRSAEFEGLLPSDRTIRSIVAQLTPEDDSSRWRLDAETANEAPFLLGVLRVISRISHGRRQHLTQNEARSLKAISRAVPDVPPALAFVVARAYIARSDEESTSDLDLMLALRPWVPGGGYFKAVRDGTLSRDTYSAMAKEFSRTLGATWAFEGVVQ